MASNSAEAPWYESFPKPLSSPGSLSRENLRAILLRCQDGSESLLGNGVVLVDVRRNDYEDNISTSADYRRKGGTIKGSINLPAQSMWYSIPSLYEILNQAQVKDVVFYCGSSGGRGTRSAAWFQDECDRKGNKTLSGKILTGGIKGWVAAGKEYADLMEGFDSSYWTTT